MTDIPTCQKDPTITSIADAVVKLKELRESNKNLNEPDIEERFARLALAFKTDKFTLCKRLDLQLRHRDTAEQNIDSELQSLRKSLNALNQLCTESDMREVITKTQQHVDILQKATLGMSRQAETYGAIEQEKRMNCAFETMLNYVEHLKLLYDKEHLELEEYRRLLAEHNLLPGGEKDDDSKRVSLPPRSHSLSSSSKPESRTRLLSSVCLLNNYEPPRTPANGQTNSSSQSGPSSPKSRRSSLPAGPTSAYQQPSGPPVITRSHSSISETIEDKRKQRSSEAEPEGAAERVVAASEKSEADCADEHAADPTPVEKDSSSLMYPTTRLSPPDPECAANIVCTVQDTDGDMGEICLLPEITIPINPKPVNLLGFIQWTSVQRIWQWDNATIILHARYAMSIMLAMAAMLTFVLTFVPNQVLALGTEDAGK